eukprot:CAMPEP_0179411856 /NCGR_PEP_ID=MMETSP0799-20121207/4134_1 /TAXON_ID=46947 /ORGANISM="Geminigera cryophila, Strain CCMP2564" /LENGTH=81 /DNA_ID=CAMNT_0021183981 /DNA_START=250 /DNA_END=493 /DNA_ORIENTATION=-
MPASADKVLLVVSSPEVAGEVAAAGKVQLVESTVEVAAEVAAAGDAEAAPPIDARQVPRRRVLSLAIHMLLTDSFLVDTPP